MVEDRNDVVVEKKRSKGSEPATIQDVIKLSIIYGIMMIAIIIIFNKVLMLNLIPSGSMENTIMTGDIVVATRYDVDEINRYDVLVFIPPDDSSTYYIKRVIGLPGETILVYNGDVYADGVKLDSSFIPETMGRSGDGEYVVPDGCYFMMGDNRNHSLDARYWTNKYVPHESIIAKAKYIVFPFTHIGSLKYDG